MRRASELPTTGAFIRSHTRGDSIRDLNKRSTVVLLLFQQSDNSAAEDTTLTKACQLAFSEDFCFKHIVLEGKPDRESKRTVDKADLVITNSSEYFDLFPLGPPVFLSTPLANKEGALLRGAVDLLSGHTDHRLLRRRAENLLVRLEYEHRTFADRSTMFHRLGVRRKSTTSLDSVLDDCEEERVNGDGTDDATLSSPVSAANVAASAIHTAMRNSISLSRDESPTDRSCEGVGDETDARSEGDIDELHQYDHFDQETSFNGKLPDEDENADHEEPHDTYIEDDLARNEIMFLRKKSAALQYQLWQQKQDSVRALQIMHQFHSDFARVSDLLAQFEGPQEQAPGENNISSTIREIYNVVDKQRFVLGDLQVDEDTRRWLTATFQTQETGIQLESRIQEEDNDEAESQPAQASSGASGRRRSNSSAGNRTPGRDTPESSASRGTGSPHKPVPSSASTASEHSKLHSAGSQAKHRQSLHTVMSGPAAPTRVPVTKLEDIIDVSEDNLEADEKAEQGLCKGILAMLQSELEWNVWALSELQMMAAASEMLHAFGMVTAFGVRQTAFREFFSVVARNYRNNFYHNLHHGFDVMKTCFFFLEHCALGQDIPNLSGYALLIAGLCHDIGHPGKNNVFQIKTSSELAVRYNDKSVLENFHAALTFRCIRKCNDGMYGTLDLTGRKEMRKIIVDTILATDISTHVKMLKIIQSGRGDHLMQLKLILCVSDVSNPLKPPRIADRWSNLINEEFFGQGDEERRLRMEISPFCDRTNQNAPQLTLNFIDFVVSPILNALSHLYPQYPERFATILDVLATRREATRVLIHPHESSHGADVESKEPDEPAKPDAHAGANKAPLAHNKDIASPTRPKHAKKTTGLSPIQTGSSARTQTQGGLPPIKSPPRSPPPPSIPAAITSSTADSRRRFNRAAKAYGQPTLKK